MISIITDREMYMPSISTEFNEIQRFSYLSLTAYTK